VVADSHRRHARTDLLDYPSRLVTEYVRSRSNENSGKNVEVAVTQSARRRGDAHLA
jgi:hypothetical protein